jgi:hypothetical protein
MATHGASIRLLAREVVLARDGVDYVEGRRGYRMLKAEFIQPLIRRCRDERMVYLAAHNHGGTSTVAFSDDDMASHERGYPALLDLVRGMPVGALVYARNAVAGDIWMADGSRLALDECRLLGANVTRLHDRPRASVLFESLLHQRQIQMFGAEGQALLRMSKVGVIGAGGVGSLLVEYLARLGVGHIVVADGDRIALSNLSRVVGATRADALYPLSHPRAPAMVRRWAERHAKRKVDIAARVATAAKPDIHIDTEFNDFAKRSTASRFLDCDFLFLAADTMRARLVFNAVVQQYFIPGLQLGTKVVASDGGNLQSAFGVERWVLPQRNCLWCAGMISPHLLAVESKTNRERADQEYGTRSTNPSVITMNAVVAAHAVNDFLLSYLGLFDDSVAADPLRFQHLKRERIVETYTRNDECPECGTTNVSRLGRGDAADLPTLQL